MNEQGQGLTSEQRALADVMSGISERIWCAGWLTGIEYRLWDCLTDKVTPLTDTSKWPCVAAGELRVLRVLSDLVGGWIVWDHGEKFVTMLEWEKMVEEYNK